MGVELELHAKGKIGSYICRRHNKVLHSKDFMALKDVMVGCSADEMNPYFDNLFNLLIF